MFDISKLRLRKAVPADQEDLARLLQRRSFIQRHLSWGTPLDWLGSEPFLILEEDGSILGALACPPDEDGITWLQLFAAAPGVPIYLAWSQLWPAARHSLEISGAARSVCSLVIREEMDQLLAKSLFSLVNEVVVLFWDHSWAAGPGVREDLAVRPMRIEDLEDVYRVDRLAFEFIWRNSRSQLKAAFREAFSSTVVEYEGRVQGYQISTWSPQGGHLARLAVNPEYQSQGMGSALLADLLDRFLDHGILEVSVNTQAENLSSLDLYRKFGFRLQEARYPVRQYSFPG